jgi:uncharacterized protein
MINKDTLREVIILQRDSLDKLSVGVKRENKIKVHSSFAVIITGIRRAGKSTLLHQILKESKLGYYLNLEDPRLEGFDLSDFNKIESLMKEIYGKGGVYFFDEIQNVEKWEKFIRYLVDKKEKVILTGSNASLLSRDLGTKLTGRYLQTEILPFSYREFLTMENLKLSVNSFEKYLFQGGFPEYLKQKNPQILQELLKNIIMRDVAVKFGIKNTHYLIKIATYLLSHAGKEFSYNSIKNMLKIKSVQSVIDYITYFEDAYLIFTIPRFSYSYKQQQVNAKKVYSIDNGFSSVNSASFSKDKGKLLENLVFLELRRKFKEIFYFQEKHECDFIIKEKEKITSAFQVCFEFNEENKKREIDGVLEAMNKFNLKEGLILTFNQEDEFVLEGKKIKLIPVWKWLK